MKKTGLGKGLEAIFAANIVESSPSGVINVRISSIEPNLAQPRKEFDAEKLSELCDSIKEHGVIQPLIVRPIGDERYQIVAGERRWRAARLAGLAEVPVVVREYDDEQAMLVAMIENLQREDLNPVEQAEGYRVLIEKHGLTQEQVAARTGKSRPAIANALRILSLPEQTLAYIKSGEISAGHARAILSVEGDTARAELTKRIINEGLSVREAEKLAKKMSKRDTGAAKPNSDGRPADYGGAAYIAEIEKRISTALGRSARIRHGDGRGKIELEYTSDADFECLLGQLGVELQ